MDAMTIVGTLAIALGASFTSGINLYATVAVLGLLHRYTGFDLPGSLDVLASNWVVWPAAILYAVEFAADKIPALDSAWDAVHTFIRVPAGAVIAAAALGDVPVEIQMFAGLVGGTLALGTHTTKAATRLVAHSTGTSPVVSPTVSLIEDVGVVGVLALIVANPILGLAVVAVLIVALGVFMWLSWKLMRRAFRAITGRSSKSAIAKPELTAA